MLYFSTKYQCIDKNYSFHLIYNMIFYSSWFVSYEGKPDTTPVRCCLSLMRYMVYPYKMEDALEYCGYNFVVVHDKHLQKEAPDILKMSVDLF